MVKVRLKKVGRPFIFKMNSRAWIISLFGMIAATLKFVNLFGEEIFGEFQERRIEKEKDM